MNVTHFFLLFLCTNINLQTRCIVNPEYMRIDDFCFISLIRYEIKELKTTSTKLIINSLMNLTVTVNFRINKPKKVYLC